VNLALQSSTSFLVDPRYYQWDAVNSVFDYYNEQQKRGNPLILMPTGCHAKDARILMFDGSVKLVQDVHVGDKLMGPDSQPREVLALARGRQEMARIIPTKGEPFIVNIDHILNVKKVKEGSGSPCHEERYENITVRKYCEGTKWFKHVRKLRRTSVEFRPSWQTLDPYFVGIMLGDGSLANGTVTFTASEQELADAFYQEAIKHDCRVSVTHKPDNAASGYVASYRSGAKNPIYAKFEKMGLGRSNSYTVFIPNEYKIANTEQRLQLLAGIIDAEGHHTTGGYDITSVSKKFIEDIIFVARSLGFSAYISEKDATLNGKFISKAYRTCISGDIDRIPVRIDYKVAEPRQQIKDVLCTGFTVEHLPEDDFYGFSLSGDHLYLTDDFTVHHNTGKSIVLALLIYLIMQHWPGQRLIMGTHSKELVRQNGKKLEELWPGVPLGIHSDGLKKRDTQQPIIYGGIQSMIANPLAFGWRDILFVDEAHMISASDETQWLMFIEALRSINPKMKVIGLTATGYRMGLGWLTNGPIFTDICYDLTSLQAFNKLLAEGWLSPLISPKTIIGISRNGIKTASNGDFVQKEAEKASLRVTWEAVQDAARYKESRYVWLVFAGGIEHAEKTAAMLREVGITATAVHSGNKEYPMSTAESDQRLLDFKAGKYQACVNYGKLTTGFDHPQIDLIMMLRLTKSTILWVQMLGRGTRPFEGNYYLPPKQNCLVLDYARNIETLGPINDPVIPRKKGEGNGDAPVKICDHCGGYNHISARYCVMCNEEFEFAVKIKQEADKAHEPLRDVTPVYEEFNVWRVFYRRHTSRNRLDSLCISYSVEGRTLPITEWVHIESGGRARFEAEQWWMQRSSEPCPQSIDEALRVQSSLRVPTKILVHTNTQFPKVMRCEYE